MQIDATRAWYAFRHGGQWIALCTSLVACAVSTSKRPDDVTMILLERDPCFGTCPEYSVRVTRDGVVQFEGKSWVKDFGPRAGYVSEESYRHLVQALEAADFDNLPNDFPAEACEEFSTCNPKVWVTVMKNTRLKRVGYYFGCRGGRFKDDFARIVELGERIDEIVGTSRWVGAGDERRAVAPDSGVNPH